MNGPHGPSKIEVANKKTLKLLTKKTLPPCVTNTQAVSGFFGFNFKLSKAS